MSAPANSDVPLAPAPVAPRLPAAVPAPEPASQHAPTTVTHADELGASSALRVARFVDDEERARVLARFDGMKIAIDTIGPNARGRVGDVIDEAIDQAIVARGGAAPGATAHSERAAAFDDRMFRARRVGVTAMCIALPSLARAAGVDGALEPSDVATLRWLVRATNERALTLLLDARDRELAAHATPVALRSILPIEGAATSARNTAATVTPSATTASVTALTATPTPTTPPTPAAIATATPTAAAIVTATSTTAATAITTSTTTTTKPPRSITAGASMAGVDDAWRHWALQLTAAKGPQTLAAFERLFAQSYVPLSSALAAGLDDPRARVAHDDFRRAFEKTYTEACATFAVTGKRPKMVLDAIDLANRSARLHGARTAQLLLVDGMRWDVGERIKKRLTTLLGARASLTDEWIFWSALPTTTARQLVTLARGLDALRSPVEREQDIESLRGRTAEFVRRMKLGSRDVHKLDLVEARVREAGTEAAGALDAIAEHTSQVIARHAEGLAPRTLLLVFGDHGFTFDRTGVAQQGGASPEEVLVPAFALLIGDVH